MKKVFILLFLIGCVYGFSLDVSGKVGLGYDVFGINGNEAAGISLRYFFSEIAGIQFFILPVFLSEDYLDLSIGVSPLFNLLSFNINEEKSKIIVELGLQLLYSLSGNLSSGSFDQTIIFDANLGVEFFINKIISIGYKIGYGTAINYWGTTKDWSFKFDVLTPAGLRDFIFYIPVHIYFS